MSPHQQSPPASSSPHEDRAAPNSREKRETVCRGLVPSSPKEEREVDTPGEHTRKADTGARRSPLTAHPAPPTPPHTSALIASRTSRHPLTRIGLLLTPWPN